jgi:type VI secretion system protein VasD
MRERLITACLGASFDSSAEEGAYTDPVNISVQGNLLAMAGANPKPVKHDAPQQSATAVAASAASSVSTASAASKAAAQNISSAADALTSAKASAAGLSKSAAGLLSH